MASLQQLHQLVHSLDKNEKRNLSLVIESIGGKARDRYMVSFRILNEQKEFDADKLKAKLSGHVKGMNLSEANTNFYSFICKTIGNYNIQAPGNVGLLKELTLVETLISKGLYEHAEDLLQPLLEKLNQGNSFGLLSRGQELQSILSATIDRLRLDFDKRLSFMDERIKTAENHRQYLDVMRLNIRLTSTAQLIGDPRQESHKKLYEEMFNSPVFQLSISKVSHQVFIMYVPLRTDIIRLAEGNKAAIVECLSALNEFKKRFNLRDHYTAAFYILDNLVSDYVREKDAEGILQSLTELESLLPFARHKAVHQKIVAKIMFAELAHSIIIKNYAGGVSHLDKWMAEDKQAQWNGAPLDYINYLLSARLHYLNNNPGKALDYLILLQDKEKRMRASMQICYRFLFLLCHYKLRNFQFLEYATLSLQKNLSKLDKLYGPEKALLQFLKRCSDFDKVKNELQKLSVTFNQFEQDPYNKPFFEFGDYNEWLIMEMEKKKV